MDSLLSAGFLLHVLTLMFRWFGVRLTTLIFPAAATACLGLGLKGGDITSAPVGVSAAATALWSAVWWLDSSGSLLAWAAWAFSVATVYLVSTDVVANEKPLNVQLKSKPSVVPPAPKPRAPEETEGGAAAGASAGGASDHRRPKSMMHHRSTSAMSNVGDPEGPPVLSGGQRYFLKAHVGLGKRGTEQYVGLDTAGYAVISAQPAQIELVKVGGSSASEICHGDVVEVWASGRSMYGRTTSKWICFSAAKKRSSSRFVVQALSLHDGDAAGDDAAAAHVALRENGRFELRSKRWYSCSLCQRASSGDGLFVSLEANPPATASNHNPKPQGALSFELVANPT